MGTSAKNRMLRWIAFGKLLVALGLIFLKCRSVNGFSFVLMGRKGRGNLKRLLSDDDSKVKPSPRSSASVNQGRGQEITGVSLPEMVRMGLRWLALKLVQGTNF